MKDPDVDITEGYVAQTLEAWKRAMARLEEEGGVHVVAVNASNPSGSRLG